MKAHTFRDDAREEARRLARQNPGVKFVVLEAQETFESNAITEIRLAEYIPF